MVIHKLIRKFLGQGGYMRPGPALAMGGVVTGAGVAAILIAITAGGDGSSCDRNATTATFAAELAAATTGQTICLATGNYGAFAGTNKAVTIKAAASATPTMGVDFDTGDTGFTLAGMTGMSGLIAGGATNITIKDSTFTGTLEISTTTNNAGIVLDHNTHNDITPSGGVSGRIHIDGTGTPIGVTVKNSTINGGYADGIRADANGIQILNNSITNVQDAEPFHGDPIQIFGGSDVTIRDNYFDQNNGSGLPDTFVAAIIQVTGGATRLTIQNNIFRAGEYGDVMNIGNDSGTPSTITHNTLEAGARGTCTGFQQRCGLMNITGGSPVVKDNIVGLLPGSGTSTFNLIYFGSSSGTNIGGTPTYVGGSNPTTIAGMALASGSPGKAAASDGTDMGANVTTVGPGNGA